jgi:hypothetical protein
MALTSPGVEVTIIDQSQYLPAPTASVPFVLLATAQDKANPNGIGIAQGTTAANAGKLYEVTSQRDLTTLFGIPFFYEATNGTPLQGYELNEYGLLAAYSALGVTNRAYVLRADIDLASLVGSEGRPTGAPDNGSYWLDTTTSAWGIYEFNATTGAFTLQTPIVISDPDQLSAGVPLASIGVVGNYAINAIGTTAAPTAASTYFYKNSSGAWVAVGSEAWLSSVAIVTGTESNPTLNAGDSFNITLGLATATITVQVGSETVSGIATEINNLGWEYLSASVNASGRLQIFSTQFNGSLLGNKTIVINGEVGTVLGDIGIDAATYYQPNVAFGTSAQQPLWQASQSTPHPTGSVWIKVGLAGNGLAPIVSQYDSTLSAWVAKNVTLSTDDVTAINTLDATGGQAIPAGTIYAQYSYNSSYPAGPVYVFERVATGATVVTGTNTAVNLTAGPYSEVVKVSQPGSTSLLTGNLVVPDNADATDFVTAWNNMGVAYTVAEVTTDGAIQITHTEGGTISVTTSTDLMADAGFTVNVTDGVKYGDAFTNSYPSTLQSSTTGVGTACRLNVTRQFGQYTVTSIAVPGTGHVVGDEITFSGVDLGGASPANDLVVIVTEVSAGGVAGLAVISGNGEQNYRIELSNWYPLTYTANEGAPVDIPANNTNWFYDTVDQVDIMMNYNGAWKGYKNQGYDSNGFPSPSIANATDPNGPIVSASAPTQQSDATALVYGDLWIDTSDLENYPLINRWQSVDGVDQWVLIDNSDQTNPSGVLFADARWATNGNTNPADDPIPTIKSLLSSNYLDLDAPSYALYPTGMLLFNTRRSGYNVKQFRVNYFNGTSFPGETLPSQKDAWVSASGLQSNGSPYMGRKAQRAMVVQALRSTIDTNVAIRDEDNFFNLMATPNYPELQPNMVVLNNDRGNTGYILGDTPMGLPMQATAIQAWATNAAGATSTGEEGCVTRDTYLGLFYPSGIAPDLDGNLVAVPPSHMMLRTFLRNDTLAYPWFAAAGTRRGQIDNATNIGYIDRDTGEFITIKTPIGIRDVLYVNFINPLVFFTGNGLLNYGNKTSFNSQSALDRTNVARLVAYIRRQLTIAGRPFVFEPNDALTRQQIAGVVESLMVDLVAKRGLYDYLVVCDESNNTPARIDRNELWIDVAVEPVKAAEFIYIPVRILNTGEL